MMALSPARNPARFLAKCQSSVRTTLMRIERREETRPRHTKLPVAAGFTAPNTPPETGGWPEQAFERTCSKPTKALLGLFGFGLGIDWRWAHGTLSPRKGDSARATLDKIARSLGVDDGLETAVAFPTTPNMMDVPLIPILGPFGGDQLMTALTAGNPEVGAAIGSYRRHRTSIVSRPISQES
jgi:hypothetical protein